MSVSVSTCEDGDSVFSGETLPRELPYVYYMMGKDMYPYYGAAPSHLTGTLPKHCSTLRSNGTIGSQQIPPQQYARKAPPNMKRSRKLHIIVSVHFVLTIFASMHGFLPGAYCYMNTIIILTGLWAIATPDSKDSVLMFVVFHAVSILADIIFLGIFFDDGKAVCKVNGANCGAFRFSATMAIINLLLKPLSLIVLGLEFRKRGGEYNMPGFPGVPPSSRGYENIDHSIPTNQQVEAAQSPSSLDKPYIPQ